MTLPRTNVLANTTRNPYTLLAYPIPPPTSLEITPSTPLLSSNNLTNNSLLASYTSTVPSGALMFSINVTNIPQVNTTGTANFTFLSSVTGEYVRGGVFLAGGNGDTPLWLDRSGVRGFDNPFFTDKFSTDVWLNPDTSTVRLYGILDRSVLEVFLNNGEKAGTMIFFAEGILDTVIIGTNDLNPGIEVSAEVVGLNSAWAAEEVGMGNGTVLGNVTAMAGGQMMRRDWVGHLGEGM